MPKTADRRNRTQNLLDLWADCQADWPLDHQQEPSKLNELDRMKWEKKIWAKKLVRRKSESASGRVSDAILFNLCCKTLLGHQLLKKLWRSEEKGENFSADKFLLFQTNKLWSSTHSRQRIIFWNYDSISSHRKKSVDLKGKLWCNENLKCPLFTAWLI